MSKRLVNDKVLVYPLGTAIAPDGTPVREDALAPNEGVEMECHVYQPSVGRASSNEEAAREVLGDYGSLNFKLLFNEPVPRSTPGQLIRWTHHRRNWKSPWVEKPHPVMLVSVAPAAEANEDWVDSWDCKQWGR